MALYGMGVIGCVWMFISAPLSAFVSSRTFLHAPQHASAWQPVQHHQLFLGGKADDTHPQAMHVHLICSNHASGTRVDSSMRGPLLSW